MTYREYFAAHGGNPIECYAKTITVNGNVVTIAVNDSIPAWMVIPRRKDYEIVGCRINGADSDTATWEQIARLVNEDYDLYSGYKDRHIAEDAEWEPVDCRDCPWFDICAAMDEQEIEESGRDGQ